METPFGTRVAEVIADLGLIPATAARLADIDPGRVHHIMFDDKNPPTASTIDKMVQNWRVPKYVFYMSREEAAAKVAEAKTILENNLQTA